MWKPACIALVITLTTGRSGDAAAPSEDACPRAREALGDAAVPSTMSPARCLEALETAEEERWQLWLDVAAADERSGHLARSALSLDRFVRAAERRTTPLAAEWVVVRDQARNDLSRMDAELLKREARITLTTDPPGAEATVLGDAAANLPDARPKTPFTAYFQVGTHTVRLLHPETGAAREVAFTVVLGQTIELKVDLRGGRPGEFAVVEVPAQPFLGQRASPDLATPQRVPPERETITGFDEEDREGPPVRHSGTGIVTSLGAVAIAAGAASVAIGLVFAMNAAGFDDEAACDGAACDDDQRLREQVRRDASVAWNRATGTFIAGGLLIAGGVIAIVLDDDPPTSALLPWFGPNGAAGVSTQVRF